MKTLLIALTLALAAALALTPELADAKRLGGGRPAGMQRAAPAPQRAAPPPAAPPQQAAPQPAAPQPAAPAPAPGKRSWLGPIAGLAAGLGLAALFSHLGMGAGLANIAVIGLLVVVALMVVRWLASRLGGGVVRTRLAGADGGSWQRERIELAPLPSTAAHSPAAETQATAALSTVPGGMATSEFERLAKLVFIRLQAANDAGNVDDLRKFTTPELFASLRLDLQERGDLAQKTDVVQLDAQVVEVGEDSGQSIVTVRFSGLMREQSDAGAQPFTELWHLVRPSGGQGDWAIAGIQPLN